MSNPKSKIYTHKKKKIQRRKKYCMKKMKKLHLAGCIKSLLSSSLKHSTSKYKNQKVQNKVTSFVFCNWKQKVHFFKIVSFLSSVAQLLSEMLSHPLISIVLTVFFSLEYLSSNICLLLLGRPSADLDFGRSVKKKTPQNLSCSTLIYRKLNRVNFGRSYVSLCHTVNWAGQHS